MLAFLNAVAACELPLPAAWIALLIAVTSVLASVTPFRLIETPIWLAPPNPGPWKLNTVLPATASEALLLVSLTIAETLVEGDPVPISVPLAPIACTPFNPRLLASTVDWLRLTETDPF